MSHGTAWFVRILFDFSFLFQVLQTHTGHEGVNLDGCIGKEDPTTFFNDGMRRIDFVLVFEETVKDAAEAEMDQATMELDNRTK